MKEGRVAIYSRTMDEITQRFPELNRPAKKPDDGGSDRRRDSFGDRRANLPFSELQTTGRKTIGDNLMADIPVVLVAYDCLRRGRVLIDEALEERLGTLAQLYRPRALSACPWQNVFRKSPRSTMSLQPPAPVATKA